MTTIDVQDEAGGSGRLAEDMHTFLADAAPYVEKVTHLQLPHTVTVKLLTAQGLATHYSAFIRRQVERDTTDVELSEAERKRAARLSMAADWAARTTWAVDASTLVTNSVGRPSTLIVPDTLTHQGLLSDPDGLCELLVRVLAEQAQVEACGGVLVPSPAWPLVPEAQDPVLQLSAGHAAWAARTATPLVLGKAVSKAQRPRSWTYRRQAALVFLASRGQQGRLLRRATAFVDTAMASTGPERFNRLWTRHDLVPTVDELRQPDRWLQRLPR